MLWQSASPVSTKGSIPINLRAYPRLDGSTLSYCLLAFVELKESIAPEPMLWVLLGVGEFGATEAFGFRRLVC